MSEVYLTPNNCCPVTCQHLLQETEHNEMTGDIDIVEWCTHSKAVEVEDGILELCPLTGKPIWMGNRS